MKEDIRINELIMFSSLARYIDFCDNQCELTYADIACDHGYIGEKLLNTGVAENVIFSDISAKSLQKARNLITKSSNIKKSLFFIGDGLSVIKSPIFACVIAGVGGREIVKILKSEKQVLSKYFVLQTSQDDLFLLNELISMGFLIVADKIIKVKNHIYRTMLVTKETGSYDDKIFSFLKDRNLIHCEISPQLLNNYKNFNSIYFGKMNILNFGENHYNTLHWLNNRLKQNLEQLNVSIESVSLVKFRAELKEKIRLLDKMLEWVI